MDSKKRESHKPPLEMRDSGVSCYTPSPPPKKSSLLKTSEGSARSMHHEVCHQHPSMESFDQNVSSNNPEEFHEQMMIPPRLDLSSIIGDDSESDVSSSGIVSTDRTSQSHDEQYPELALDTPSTDSRMSPAGRILQGYQSGIDSTSPSPAPSSSSSPSSSGLHNLRRCRSGELEDESEGSVLKVKLKLKSTRPRSGGGVRKRDFTVTKVRNSPPLSSSSDLLHEGKEQAYKHTPDDVMRSKYVPLPGIGLQGADQNINKEHGETEQKQSVIDKRLRSPTLEITPSDEKDIREQRLIALERSASQGEISRKFPTPPPQSAKTVSRRAMRMQQFARRKSASQAESVSRQGVRPMSQASDSSKSVLLAIRLPDGTRVQNLFDSTQSLQSVVQFALKQGTCSLDRSNVCLVTNDMPKRELMNLSQTIEVAELRDRTLLNLEELD
eukprot:XP_001183007.1 PREDICTED: uncharacterized protein LOC753664 [Strongylocentrotus purpuratus]